MSESLPLIEKAIKKYNTFQKDMDKSAKCINSICDFTGLRYENIIPLETMYDSPLFKKLDIHYGIDWLYNFNSKYITIAVRNQFMDKNKQPYNSFTIRFERKTLTPTEFGKRIEAMNSGDIYPDYTIQAYFDENYNILSAGMIDTKQLFQFIIKHPEAIRKNRSDNEFISIDWDYLNNNEETPSFKQKTST